MPNASMSMAVRRVLLVRHGQYDELGSGKLTRLGQKQAALTADALRGLAVDSIVSSTLIRAVETADIIARAFPGVRRVRTSLLSECIPTPLPASVGFVVSPVQIRADRKRAEQAYARFFRPSRARRLDIVVCHGNIIRFFVCRLLATEPRMWVRLNSLHCGITEVAVVPSGDVRLTSYNETGHLPRSMRTMSNAAHKAD